MQCPFGILIWPKTDLLDKLQRRSARFVKGDYRTTSNVSQTLHDLGWRDLKDHRQRIPRFVIRRYLGKSIQKKLFAIYNHYKYRLFSKKKNDYKLNFRKFTVAILSMVVTSLVPIALSSIGRKTEKWNVFTTTTIIITTELNTVNHYDKIYGVFETLTNK